MANPELQDEELEHRMDLIRKATNLGRSLRAKHKIKTRQVLPSMLIITHEDRDGDAIERGMKLLQEELNVKQVEFSTDEAKYVRLSVKPNLRLLGKRLGPKLNDFRNHLNKLNEQHDDVAKLLGELDQKETVELQGETFTKEDFLIERGPKDDRLIATEAGVTVLLDTQLTPDLIREGLARELVNRVQKLRKDSGLQISDRIKLGFVADAELAAAIADHKDYIAGETLANDIEVKPNGDLGMPISEQYDIEGTPCAIGLAVQ